MATRYTLIEEKVADGEKGDDHSPPEAPVHRRRDMILWLSIAINILLAIILSYIYITLRHERWSIYSGIRRTPHLDIQIDSYTTYSAKDHNETQIAVADAEWEKIKLGHGVVALDHEYARSRGLPWSMDLPQDPTKGVYVLDGYHQIHCLKTIRKTFYQMHRNETPTIPPEHATHCFDALRQYVMCNADDLPLYTRGEGNSGDHQVRHCKDWSALNDWATENTACWWPDEGESLGYFGICDDGFDGLYLPHQPFEQTEWP